MAVPKVSESVITTWREYENFIKWSQENPNYGVNTYAETIYEKCEALTWIKDEVAEKDRIDLIIKFIAFGFSPFWKNQNGAESEPEITDKMKTELLQLWLFLWFINRDWNMKRIQDSVKEQINFGIRGFRVRSNERGKGDPRPLFSFGSIPLGERPYWELRPELLDQLSEVACKYKYPLPDFRKSWKGCP